MEVKDPWDLDDAVPMWCQGGTLLPFEATMERELFAAEEPLPEVTELGGSGRD